MQLMLEANGSYSDKCVSTEEMFDLDHKGVCKSQTNALLRIALVMNLTQITSPFLGYLADLGGAPNFHIFMAATSLLGMALVAIAIQVGGLTDVLLYIGFPVMSTCTWMNDLLIVKLGMYFQGHAAARVILILNNLLDSGALTSENLLRLWIEYMAIAVVVYGTSSVLWRKAIPEGAKGAHSVEVTEHEETDLNGSSNRSISTSTLLASRSSAALKCEAERREPQSSSVEGEVAPKR